MTRYYLLTLVVLAAGQSALAQPAGVSAGSQLQQVPRAPAEPRSIPDIRVERGQAPSTPGPAGPRFVVKSLHVTGATRFTEAELIAATGFQPGAEMDLAGLRTLAARISDFYDRHGYFLAQAYVPAQDVEGGTVTIAVIEGRYGKVGLNNHTHVSNALAHSMLAGLDAGDVVATAPLERRLLLLSDLPGVKVQSTLQPGEAVGTSDLTVSLLPGRRVTGSLEADNAGNPYTGTYRGGGTLNLNELTGQGDMASVRFLTAGSGFNYVRGAYQAHLQDATLGVAYAHLTYRLGGRFSPLDASGTADIASLYGSYPLIRSRDTNLDVHLQFDARSFHDKVGATSFVADRTARVVIVGLTGDHHDRLLGGGWTSYSVSWAFGDLHIKTPSVRAEDALTARTNGAYNKFSFDLARLQQVAGPLSLYGEARGQLASKNLELFREDGARRRLWRAGLP